MLNNNPLSGMPALYTYFIYILFVRMYGSHVGRKTIAKKSVQLDMLKINISIKLL